MLNSVCLSVSIIDSPTVISHDIWPIGGGAKGYKEEALIWQGGSCQLSHTRRDH